MTKNKQKKDKKRIIVAVLLAAVVISAIFLLNNGSASESSPSIVVKDNADRVNYLESYGWKINPEPVEEVTIIIPKDFDEVFQDYNSIQLEQGFDLSKYAGLEAVRYTYSVTNYPGDETSVVADIVVYRNKVIAGDIQSTALDGFMHGLNLPQADAQ